MELTILHLYPDMMDLYGEYANLAVLRRRLEALGVSVTAAGCAPEDAPDFASADLIYMGAGTERRQKYALTALLPHADALKAAAERGAAVLFTGNAMETLGASVTDASGKVWQGLGLPVLWDAPAVGFMNKCSTTRGIAAPLFSRLTLGFGNEAEHGAEGYVSGNVFATHITGPVLVKNPAFLDFLTRRLFECRGWDLPEELPPLPHQREAYAVTLSELQKRIGG